MAKASAAAQVQTGQEEGSDAPLIDTLGAAVKEMIAKGKEQGFVTYDNLNAALPPDQVSSEQIENTMSQLSEMGINGVENEEAEEAAGTAEDAAAANPVAAERSGTAESDAAAASGGERRTRRPRRVASGSPRRARARSPPTV